jgi:3-deoxy-manno-octulosonate cytidylyltransferase (CMP-KDO synthetase)
MKIVAIVPARMGSTRFPGKPMEKIQGVPMIGHCYFRTRMCKDLLDTYVATCDKEIYEYIKSNGGKAVMTSSAHERATDRTAEAMQKIEEEIGEKIDVVIMVQGDEPMVVPEMISECISPFLEDENVNISNLITKIDNLTDFEDPNEVKVVIDNKSNAIYFSREPIPSRKKGFDNVPMLKQLGIIGFRRDYLLKFNDMSETPLEVIESVDMLRVIENEEKIRTVMTSGKSLGVDTPEDLKRAENEMSSDLLMAKYK